MNTSPEARGASLLAESISKGLAVASGLDLLASAARLPKDWDFGRLLGHMEAELGVVLAAENLPLISSWNRGFREKMAIGGALSGIAATAMLHSGRRELFFPAVALGAFSVVHGAHQFMETHTSAM